jgi:hypothetical protein
LSLAKSLASLPEPSRNAILARLTDRQATVVAESDRDQDIARQMFTRSHDPDQSAPAASA